MSYTDYLKNQQQEQPTPPQVEVLERPQATGQEGLDIDNLPGQSHSWVDRGMVMSCEGAGHANHHAYKRRR
jgi:hypothetical protein